jgi:hypothetical protein
MNIINYICSADCVPIAFAIQAKDKKNVFKCHQQLLFPGLNTATKGWPCSACYVAGKIPGKFVVVYTIIIFGKKTFAVHFFGGEGGVAIFPGLLYGR